MPEPNMRLYVSGQETSVGKGAKRLISALEQAGFEMFWSQIGVRGPWVIGPEINASAGVLALVNADWASSTYHSMEITFALGEGSYEGQPALTGPCPVMAYVEERESRFVRDHWLQSRIGGGEVVELPSDPESAMVTISATLGGGLT